MSDRFSDRSRHVLILAQREAQAVGDEYVGTEHLLLALLKEPSRRAAHVLRCLDVDPLLVVQVVEAILLPSEPDILVGYFPQTARVREVLRQALEEANHLGNHWIDPEHLLLGLLHDREGVGAQVLGRFGVTLHGAQGKARHLV